MWLAEDLEWVRIYYQRGNAKGSARNYEIQDPPTSGWQNALILGRCAGKDVKRVTIFCPYTLSAWTVSVKAGELQDRKDIPHDHVQFGKVQEILRRNWNAFQDMAFERDYDTAARVFELMGVDAPERKVRASTSTSSKGGKGAGDELLKPVKLSSKRGKFLEWFLDSSALTRRIDEAMSHFDMSRSNVLSYLYMLQKDHGIGYTLTGEDAALTMPANCVNPFDVPWGKEGEMKVMTAAEEEMLGEDEVDDEGDWAEEPDDGFLDD